MGWLYDVESIGLIVICGDTVLDLVKTFCWVQEGTKFNVLVLSEAGAHEHGNVSYD